jgi:hypothetical protein
MRSAKAELVEGRPNRQTGKEPNLIIYAWICMYLFKVVSSVQPSL